MTFTGPFLFIAQKITHHLHYKVSLKQRELLSTVFSRITQIRRPPLYNENCSFTTISYFPRSSFLNCNTVASAHVLRYDICNFPIPPTFFNSVSCACMNFPFFFFRSLSPATEVSDTTFCSPSHLKRYIWRCSFPCNAGIRKRLPEACLQLTATEYIVQSLLFHYLFS